MFLALAVMGEYMSTESHRDNNLLIPFNILLGLSKAIHKMKQDCGAKIGLSISPIIFSAIVFQLLQ